MADRVVLSHRPDAGITTWFHDDGYGNYVAETVQDVSAIVAENKRVQNLDTGRWGEWKRFASIPLTVLVELQKQGILDAGWNITDDKAFRRWVNDRDNQHFRTKLGAV